MEVSTERAGGCWRHPPSSLCVPGRTDFRLGATHVHPWKNIRGPSLPHERPQGDPGHTHVSREQPARPSLAHVWRCPSFFPWPVDIKWKLLIRVQLFATPWTIQSMEFSRPEYWSGSPFPSPGYLPNPAIEPRSPALQAYSLPAEPQGKPKNSGVGSQSPLQRIFWPRNQTGVSGVSYIAGRFFANWAIREAQPADLPHDYSRGKVPVCKL